MHYLIVAEDGYASTPIDTVNPQAAVAEALDHADFSEHVDAKDDVTVFHLSATPTGSVNYTRVAVSEEEA